MHPPLMPSSTSMHSHPHTHTHSHQHTHTGMHSHPHTHTGAHSQQHTHGHEPQTPVTPSLAGLQFGTSPSDLPSYEHQQHAQHRQQQQQHQPYHGHGMTQPQPRCHDSGFSSPWGDPSHAHPLVGRPPARPTSGTSTSGITTGLDNAPGSQHQQTRYGGEIGEDSWRSGDGDLEVSVKTRLLCIFVGNSSSRFCDRLFRFREETKHALFDLLFLLVWLDITLEAGWDGLMKCLITPYPSAELQSFSFHYRPRFDTWNVFGSQVQWLFVTSKLP